MHCRVSITPAVTETLVKKGFKVNVEENAGIDAKFRNNDYVSAGAKIVEDQQAFSSGELENVYSFQYSLLHAAGSLFFFCSFWYSYFSTPVLGYKQKYQQD